MKFFDLFMLMLTFLGVVSAQANSTANPEDPDAWEVKAFAVIEGNKNATMGAQGNDTKCIPPRFTELVDRAMKATIAQINSVEKNTDEEKKNESVQVRTADNGDINVFTSFDNCPNYNDQTRPNVVIQILKEGTTISAPEYPTKDNVESISEALLKHNVIDSGKYSAEFGKANQPDKIKIVIISGGKEILSNI